MKRNGLRVRISAADCTNTIHCVCSLLLLSMQMNLPDFGSFHSIGIFCPRLRLRTRCFIVAFQSPSSHRRISENMFRLINPRLAIENSVLFDSTQFFGSFEWLIYYLSIWSLSAHLHSMVSRTTCGAHFCHSWQILFSLAWSGSNGKR